jgi:hypothetical protein
MEPELELELLFPGWFKAVPHAGFGSDVVRRTLGVDFLAELRHRHSKMFRLLNSVGTPDGEQAGHLDQTAVTTLLERKWRKQNPDVRPDLSQAT